jgi:hypothetical protein
MATSSSTPFVSRPAPAWLRELADARARYEESLGWPVSVQVGRRDLVLIVGGEIAAIGMPAHLGARVRQELAIAMLSGPIVADPGANLWTFLARPIGVLRLDVAHDLAAVRVHLAPRSACVELPPTLSATPRPGRRWVDPPIPNRPLPPGSVVISLVRRLTYDDGRLAA